MDYKLYGFLIGKDVHFDIDSKRLYRFSVDGSERNLMFGSIFFNDTMLQLFIYLLRNARSQKVTKDELLSNIWEANNLSPSTQRLWQVLNKLNKKLAMIGLPEDFIKSSKGSGYIINYKEILPLYCEAAGNLNER